MEGRKSKERLFKIGSYRYLFSLRAIKKIQNIVLNLEVRGLIFAVF